MKVRIEFLEKLCVDKLVSAGLSHADAEMIFFHFLEEELLGKHSHGFIRMSSVLKTIRNFEGKSNVVQKEKSVFATQIIAENTVGLVAAHKAAECAIKKAKDNGFSIVSCIGYQGTTGALGYYGRLLVSKDLIGIITCSSEYAVAPWGGKEAILGTNPIAIAIPNEDSPIISDFSTAAMTYGELMLASKEGRKIPYGVVLDSEGKPSHNPDDANNGCQLPMAGHKGYALGLAIEILAGLFIGAKSGNKAVIGSDGILIIAFEPTVFISEEQYLSNLNALIEEIKNSSLAHNSTGIRLPGENCIQKISIGKQAGVCEIPDVVYQELLNL